jgi:hypothetical protein
MDNHPDGHHLKVPGTTPGGTNWAIIVGSPW